MYHTQLRAVLRQSRDAARLTTDAGGEACLVVDEVVTESRARVRGTRDGSEDTRLATWIANPKCAHCGEIIAESKDAALVPSEQPKLARRVAHVSINPRTGHRCIVESIIRYNPTLNVRRASQREDR